MCYSVLVFRKNLISISKLLDDDFSISFNNNLVIISKGLLICIGNVENNLYVLRLLTHNSLLNTEMFKVEKQKKNAKRFLTMTHIYGTLDLVTLTLIG